MYFLFVVGKWYSNIVVSSEEHQGPLGRFQDPSELWQALVTYYFDGAVSNIQVLD